MHNTHNDNDDDTDTTHPHTHDDDDDDKISMGGWCGWVVLHAYKWWCRCVFPAGEGGVD